MRFIFSTIKDLELDSKVFTLLCFYSNRYYYISTDYLTRYLEMQGDAHSIEIFVKELKASGGYKFFDLLELWLNVRESEIVNLTVGETETFLELYDMRDSSDLFLNLGEKAEGDERSIGEIIFINSLTDLIFRGRG